MNARVFFLWLENSGVLLSWKDENLKSKQKSSKTFEKIQNPIRILGIVDDSCFKL